MEFVEPLLEVIELPDNDIITSSLCSGGNEVICEEDWCYQLTGKVDEW